MSSLSTTNATGMDSVFKALHGPPSRLGRVFFNIWAGHKCAGEHECMRFFVIDGHVKASHPVCALERLLDPRSEVFEMDETGPIPVGCREPPMQGSIFCKKHHATFSPADAAPGERDEVVPLSPSPPPPASTEVPVRRFESAFAFARRKPTYHARANPNVVTPGAITGAARDPRQEAAPDGLRPVGRPQTEGLRRVHPRPPARPC